MIFGCIGADVNNQDRMLSNIFEHLRWDDCISESYSFDFFSCVYIIDPRIALSGENVFYLDEVGGIAILIDGFIYNWREISSRLSFSDKSVKLPELVAKAYFKWGISFAEKLNGDFAICIYQKKEKQAIFFRDHIGLRPLAISKHAGTVYFATDIMGLCRALYKQEKINPDYLLNLFMLTGRDHSILPHKDIFKLNPGHYLLISPNHQEYKPYWFPGNIKTDNNLTWPQARQELLRILTDAVKLRSDQNFRASAHVSGGLDSGIVSSLARKEYSWQHDFYGFSWSPDIEFQPGEVDDDERLLVDKTCRQNNIIPVYVNFDINDYLAFLSDWRNPSELLTERKTVESAADKGVNLIFSGWGGDEFISCAERGIDADLIRSFDWNYFLRKYPPRQLKKFISALLFNALFPSSRYKYARYKTSEEIYCYIRNRDENNLIPRKERFRYNSRRDVHIQLIRRYHLASRAADWYVLGQRNGIEYRYPLLDKRIVEYMLKIPSRCLVDGNKSRIILRELGKGLMPDELLTHESKADTVLSYLFQSIVASAKDQFIDEFETYRNNPDLGFVDFELIRKNLPGMSAHGQHKNISNDPKILYYLKSAHEFTKGYYGP